VALLGGRHLFPPFLSPELLAVAVRHREPPRRKSRPRGASRHEAQIGVAFTHHRGGKKSWRGVNALHAAEPAAKRS